MKYIKRYNEDLEWEFNNEEHPDIPDDFINYEEFYEFLIEQNILDRYINNFYSERSKGFRKLHGYKSNNINDFLNKYDEYDYIVRPILWGDYDFWSDINNKWLDYLESTV